MANKEETLDPVDWEDFRKVGYELVDLLVTYHQSVRERPVWHPIPDEIKEKFVQSVPMEPANHRDIIQEFKETILPYPTGNIHPRFWGWVHGTGTSFGAYAELLAAMMNPNTGGREHIAHYVEHQVILWLAEILSFPPSSSGILTSGCSIANLTCLAVARQYISEENIRKTGLKRLDKQLVVYGSDQVHSSIQKALEVLGLGSDALRKIDTTSGFQIDLVKLRNKISMDRADGFLPMAIVGNAGTVNSGAFDNLSELAKIAKEENIWFHIDAAFGAFACLLDDYNHVKEGISQANSIAFDMHKWMSMPYEIGCAMVQNEDSHRDTFSLRPTYLTQYTRGLASLKKWPTDYGIELSRGFRALKAWMSIKEHGMAKYKRVITKNVNQANYLGNLIDSHQNFELATPVTLNIVCFRFVHPKLSNNLEKEINQELLFRIQESGIAVFSDTMLHRDYVLRIALTNQRTLLSDLDYTFHHLLEIGHEIINERFN